MDDPGDGARIVVLGEGGGRELAIGERVSIGRSEGELVLSELRASRCHAEISRVGPRRYRIEDLGSLNGTYVNGQRIAGCRDLFHGDEVQIGGARLRFVCPSCLRDPEAPSDPLLERPGAAVEPLAVPAAVLAGEARGVALVASVHSYGSLAEKLPREALREFAQGWQRGAAERVRASGGVAADWDESGVLIAHWPLGPDPRCAAQSALHSARELARGAAQYAARFRECFESGFFELDIGLDLAEEAAGGDAVERARALADRCKEKGYSVLLSRELARSAGSGWSFAELGELALADGSALHILALEDAD